MGNSLPCVAAIDNTQTDGFGPVPVKLNWQK